MKTAEVIMLCGRPHRAVETATPCPCDTCGDYDRCMAEFSGDYEELKLKIIQGSLPAALPHYPPPRRRVVRNDVRTELAVYCARTFTRLTHAEIRDGLGLEPSNDTAVIFSEFKRKLARDPALSADVEYVLTRLEKLIRELKIPPETGPVFL